MISTPQPRFCKWTGIGFEYRLASSSAMSDRLYLVRFSFLAQLYHIPEPGCIRSAIGDDLVVCGMTIASKSEVLPLGVSILVLVLVCILGMWPNISLPSRCLTSEKRNRGKHMHFLNIKERPAGGKTYFSGFSSAQSGSNS